MDFVLEGFKSALKKRKKSKKGIAITPMNFEHFKAEIVNDGVFDLVSLMHLSEWADTTLRQLAHELNFIFQFHKDSPRRFWNKIEKDTEGFYNIGLDLETFMESDYSKKQRKRTKELGFSIPDNYELAKKNYD